MIDLAGFLNLCGTFAFTRTTDLHTTEVLKTSQAMDSSVNPFTVSGAVVNRYRDGAPLAKGTYT
ncbi:hypothetical protein YSY43_31640 [Paenibacillus sp. YSY-4.3]